MKIPQLTNGELTLVLFNILTISSFTILSFSRANYEFILYIAVIVFFFAFFFLNRERFNLPLYVLWLLTGWSVLHMAGGLLSYTEGQVLYNLVIVDLIGDPYTILKYDQVVHAYGFFTTTLVLYYIYRDRLVHLGFFSLLILLVTAACGFGALNEIIEFAATVIVPETNVGGYINTALDLCFNLLGACLAAILIYRIRD